MSFFKKLTKEFDELKASFGDDKEKEKTEEKKEEKKEEKHGDKPLGYESHDRGFDSSYDQSGYQPSQYQSGYQPPQHQSGYPPSQHDSGYQPLQHQFSPPPVASPPSAPPPPLPLGWTCQWDSNNKRAFYIEQATGRTQWEFPGHNPGSYDPHGAPGHESSRGHSDSYYGAYGGAMPSVPHQSGHGAHQESYYGGHDAHGGGSHGYDAHGSGHGDGHGDKKDKDKKGSDNTKLFAAAGAGVVGGALIGAAIGECLPFPVSYLPFSIVFSMEMGRLC
ncbi:hypothetical protein M501DRAFT_454246 [Patellaria atrata CBS 101060]|uniref:WW domain-containing protein n=1 Tax=Patellaria atrata CBS 101060 TaxID=1346257 RepID=A0A9P4S558_9PEZI|nr:hypothetical protein M501DRAFT_454246 [Patellaria atrata CBS 101060]